MIYSLIIIIIRNSYAIRTQNELRSFSSNLQFERRMIVFLVFIYEYAVHRYDAIFNIYLKRKTTEKNENNVIAEMGFYSVTTFVCIQNVNINRTNSIHTV